MIRAHFDYDVEVDQTHLQIASTIVVDFILRDEGVQLLSMLSKQAVTRIEDPLWSPLKAAFCRTAHHIRWIRSRWLHR